MKAILVTQLGGPETMQYTDVDIPKISAAQVLIRVEMASVNFADIKSRYGKKGAAKLPFIPGLDATGVIEEVGSEVKNLRVGQRVIAFPANGSYAEYVVADEALTFAIPDSISTETAAACPVVSFTSYQLLAKVARLAEGETVLIHAAAGGIGTTAIQLAKLLGAGRVIGSVGSAAKAAVALAAGADHVICHDTEDFVEKVRELTDGAGADVILDSISGRVSERSIECLAWYGRLVHFGNASGEIGQIRTLDLHASCRSVLGFSFGTTRKLRPHLLQDTARQVIDFLAKGQLDVKIGKVFSLEEAANAHAWVESRQSTGKVLLQVRP
ncbi:MULTISPECIES: NADPH:quinone oxidoreductase family protein [unclassified Brevibacillus]|uniref:quinone oxidoreductase family protein n=1 Tax=unclassified Brevibacillus TaxID=2684853 RepID=UPI00156B29BF|nr:MULTISPECIES: NADPH:quinone oxidoreductase family protein [unclassified Brevibacillus]MDH6348463.1 NADPH2:quinone reductase [Brevibacillus sp. 1238]UED70525.1 NADPH:quinone oxidoreductase family protein [Brevibacillus sp. HD3.3A]